MPQTRWVSTSSIFRVQLGVSSRSRTVRTSLATASTQR